MNDVQFVIGSASQAKIDTVKSVVATLIETPFVVSGKNVQSGVPDTPWDVQTKQGASNRAKALADKNIYAIGIESGLVERYGDIYEESWSCIIFEGKRYYGYSSGLQLPTYVTNKMTSMKLEHGPAMRAIREIHRIENDKDTWGLYTNYALLRAVSLEESLRNALIQIFAPAGHLYE